MKLSENDFITKQIHFDFAGVEIDFLEVVNHQELVDQFNAQIESSMDQPSKDKLAPYWSRLWFSSIALGEYLAEQKIVEPGMKVIELGCGLGLSGIVASKMGGDVTFTDYDPNALIFAKKSWELNDASPAKFEIMDWNDPNPDFKADLVLGADVAYGPDFGNLLMKTFDVVCKPGGLILLTDPMRSFAKEFYNNFETSIYEASLIRKKMKYEGRSQTQRITSLKKPV